LKQALKNKKMLKRNIFIILPLLLLGSLAFAQQPFINQYYHNQYLINPANVGINDGLVIGLAYRNQFNSVAGAPVNQAITASYKAGKNVGLGLQVNNSSIGLLKSTAAVLSYAYHLPLSKSSEQLHFGVSVGGRQLRLAQSDITASNSDPVVGQFSDRPLTLESNFGIAYTNDKLNLQFSLPNLSRLLKSDIITTNNYSYYAAASYLFLEEQNLGFSVEPILTVQGIIDNDPLIGGGAKLNFLDDKFNLLGYYGNNKVLSFGLGFTYDEIISFQGNYNASNNQLPGFSNSFEIGLNILLKKKK